MTKSLTLTVLLAISTVSVCAYAQNSPFSNPGTQLPVARSTVLPVDEAFALQTFIEAPDTLVLLWDIREAHYLYRKSIMVTDPDGHDVDFGELPEGSTHTDEFFGDVKVYYDRLIHRFPLANLARDGNAVSFTVLYQGCAEDLYCYPVQEKEITLALWGQ